MYDEDLDMTFPIRELDIELMQNSLESRAAWLDFCSGRRGTRVPDPTQLTSAEFDRVCRLSGKATEVNSL